MRVVNDVTDKSIELRVNPTTGGLLVDPAGGGDADEPGYVAPATGAVFPVAVASTIPTLGSKAAATGSAEALAASTTTYTGGVDIWNADTADAVTIGGSGVTAGAGDGKVVLGPGQGFHYHGADLSVVYIRCAAGTPIVSWSASTR